MKPIFEKARCLEKIRIVSNIPSVLESLKYKYEYVAVSFQHTDEALIRTVERST
jgi:hypothetical protein